MASVHALEFKYFIYAYHIDSACIYDKFLNTFIVLSSNILSSFGNVYVLF